MDMGEHVIVPNLPWIVDSAWGQAVYPKKADQETIERLRGPVN